MHIVSWRKPSRAIPKREQDDFFCEPAGATTIFNFETADLRLDPHHGAFSLKTVSSGEESYQLGRREVVLTPGNLLLVNSGQEYASAISKPTRSLSIFFEQGDVKRAFASVYSSLETQLDHGTNLKCETPEAPQIPVYEDEHLRRARLAVNAAAEQGDHDAAELASRECLLRTLALFSREFFDFRLSSVRKRSTRDELLQRLRRARMYIDDSNGLNSSLSDMAKIACISEYHFARLFKEAFGVTPSLYARRRRLAHANDCLKKGGDRTDAARLAGFPHFNRFVRAYRAAFGTHPEDAVQN